jgi:2'-5' RNA ligase
VRSIELTLTPASDAAVRAMWTAVAEVGLPSLAAHTSDTNRPHVTLAAGPTLSSPGSLPSLPAPPASLRLGGWTLFDSRPAADGSARFVLARAVVVDPELATFHRAVHAAAVDAVPTTLPGAWSPHLTIARRLSAPRVAVALEALAALTHPDSVAVAGVRYWDGDTRTVTPLA